MKVQSRRTLEAGGADAPREKGACDSGSRRFRSSPLNPSHPTGEGKGRAGGPKNGVSLEPKWRREAKQDEVLAVASDRALLVTMSMEGRLRWQALTTQTVSGDVSLMIGSKAVWKELQQGISTDLSSPSLRCNNSLASIFLNSEWQRWGLAVQRGGVSPFQRREWAALPQR